MFAPLLASRKVLIMVSGIFGLPGVGKSLICSWLAYRAINGKSINVHGFSVGYFNKYQRVYTNFPCKGAYKLDFDELGLADYNNCLIVIDEIQLFSDSRNFRNFGENLTWFFTCHRHQRIDVVWCTQHPQAVDKRIRSVTDRLYYLDRTLFDLLRVREILSYFDINGDLKITYEYASGFNSHYFIPSMLYKYNDTSYTPKTTVVRPAPSVLWDVSHETIERLGTIEHQGETVGIYSDGNAYYEDNTDSITAQ